MKINTLKGNTAPLLIKILALVSSIALLCFFSIKNQRVKANDLSIRGRYTIGTTKGWGHNHRSSKFFIYYEYSFKGSVYRESMHETSISKIDTKEGEYIVLLDPENPRNSKMLFDKKVKYSRLMNFVDTGWITLPDFIVLHDSAATVPSFHSTPQKDNDH